MISRLVWILSCLSYFAFAQTPTPTPTVPGTATATRPMSSLTSSYSNAPFAVQIRFTPAPSSISTSDWLLPTPTHEGELRFDSETKRFGAIARWNSTRNYIMNNRVVNLIDHNSTYFGPAFDMIGVAAVDSYNREAFLEVRKVMTYALQQNCSLLILFHLEKADNSRIFAAVANSTIVTLNPLNPNTPGSDSPPIPIAPYYATSDRRTLHGYLYPALGGPTWLEAKMHFDRVFSLDENPELSVMVVTTDVGESIRRYLNVDMLQPQFANLKPAFSLGLIYLGSSEPPVTNEGSAGISSASYGVPLFFIGLGLIIMYILHSRYHSPMTAEQVKVVADYVAILVQRMHERARAEQPLPTTDPRRFEDIELDESTMAQLFDKKNTLAVDSVRDPLANDDLAPPATAAPAAATATATAATHVPASNGEAGEVCSICIEQFTPGGNVRQLSCKHVFHVNCIDPWLSTTSSLCPLCKADMRTSEEIAQHKPNLDIAALLESLVTEFNSNIDEICMTHLGRMIVRYQAVKFLVTFEGTPRPFMIFKTAAFIRNGGLKSNRCKRNAIKAGLCGIDIEAPITQVLIIPFPPPLNDNDTTTAAATATTTFPPSEQQ